MAVRLGRRVDEKRRVAEAPLTSLLVRRELVRAIALEAERADPHETGGPLFGTVERSWAGNRFALLVSVLGTVLPVPGTHGKLASVSLGLDDGDRAGSALRWLRATTGLDLLHLGDWHAHPSGLCRPSPGDVRTAIAMQAESGVPAWLSAIAVTRSTTDEEIAACDGAATYTRDRLHTAEVRFFEAAGRGLVPLPVCVDGTHTPRLPPLPWHIGDPVRFAAECRLLAAGGFATAVGASPNGTPGLSFRVQRDGCAPLTVLTGTRYPRKAPELRDERGRRLVLRTPHSPDRFLVDVVREVAP